MVRANPVRIPNLAAEYAKEWHVLRAQYETNQYWYSNPEARQAVDALKERYKERYRSGFQQTLEQMASALRTPPLDDVSYRDGDERKSQRALALKQFALYLRGRTRLHLLDEVADQERFTDAPDQKRASNFLDRDKVTLAELHRRMESVARSQDHLLLALAALERKRFREANSMTKFGRAFGVETPTLAAMERGKIAADVSQAMQNASDTHQRAVDAMNRALGALSSNSVGYLCALGVSLSDATDLIFGTVKDQIALTAAIKKQVAQTERGGMQVEALSHRWEREKAWRVEVLKPGDLVRVSEAHDDPRGVSDDDPRLVDAARGGLVVVYDTYGSKRRWRAWVQRMNVELSDEKSMEVARDPWSPRTTSNDMDREEARWVARPVDVILHRVEERYAGAKSGWRVVHDVTVAIRRMSDAEAMAPYARTQPGYLPVVRWAVRAIGYQKYVEDTRVVRTENTSYVVLSTEVRRRLEVMAPQLLRVLQDASGGAFPRFVIYPNERDPDAGWGESMPVYRTVPAAYSLTLERMYDWGAVGNLTGHAAKPHEAFALVYNREESVRSDDRRRPQSREVTVVVKGLVNPDAFLGADTLRSPIRRVRMLDYEGTLREGTWHWSRAGWQVREPTDFARIEPFAQDALREWVAVLIERGEALPPL